MAYTSFKVEIRAARLLYHLGATLARLQLMVPAGKPVWVKPQCVFCLACLHRCPAQAIQYGKATAKRRRYLNPNVNDLP